MAELYRNLLIVICIGLLIWGFIRIERIYQYPFFMGAIFVSFIVPQAFALVDNPGLLDQQSLERVLLMSCLCAAACWVGYQGKPNLRWINKLNIDIDKNKLFQLSILLMFIGYYSNFLMIKAIPETESVGGGAWTGPATIYFFFARVIYISFAIFLLEMLKKPSIKNIIFTLLASWIPLQTVFTGRRQETMTVLIIIGLSLWLIRRYIPPRWVIIVSVFLMIILIPVIGDLRGSFWEYLFSGQWQRILSSTQEAINTQQGGDILELRNAAFSMAAAAHTNSYGFGAGWWDAIIHQFIPGQIVGFGLKESLKFNLLNGGDIYKLYGYSYHPGTTTTGVSTSFMEFSYLGCLVFALIAYVFKNLWVSAYYQKSTFSSLIYIGIISPAMLGLTHSIGRFIIEAIFQISVIGLVVYYAKVELKPLSTKRFKENF